MQRLAMLLAAFIISMITMAQEGNLQVTKNKETMKASSVYLLEDIHFRENIQNDTIKFNP